MYPQVNLTQSARGQNYEISDATVAMFDKLFSFKRMYETGRKELAAWISRFIYICSTKLLG